MQSRDRRSRLFGLHRLPFFAELHFVGGQSPRQRKTGHPLLPGLLLLGEKRIQAFYAGYGAVGRNRELDAFATGVHTLLFPIRIFFARAFQPNTRVQGQKLTAQVNRCLAACLLNVQDLNAQ